MADTSIRDEGAESTPTAITDTTDSSLRQSPKQATLPGSPPSEYKPPPESNTQSNPEVASNNVPTSSIDLESEIKATTKSSSAREEDLKETISYSPRTVKSDAIGLQSKEPPLPRVHTSDSFVSDLVSLSSESDHEDDMDFLQAEEDSPTEQTSQDDQPEMIADMEEEVTNVTADTSSDGNTSDEWLKVDRVIQTSEVVDIPTTGHQREEGSYVSSSKTVEVLATSDYKDDTLMLNPISQSITSLEDDETEKFENSESTTAGTGTLANLCHTTAEGFSPMEGFPRRQSPCDTPFGSGYSHSQPLTGEHRTHEAGSTTVGDGSSANSGSPDLGSGRRVSVEDEESERGKSGRLSPYLMISKTGNVAKVSEFESPGLLYAKANKSEHNRDLLQPADEVAEDALEAYQEESKGDDGEDGQSGELDNQDGANTQSYEVGLEVGTAPIDPQILDDLERRAQRVAANLNQVMDNLKNSLHAITGQATQQPQASAPALDDLMATNNLHSDAPPSYTTAMQHQNQATTTSATTQQTVSSPNTQGRGTAVLPQGDRVMTDLPPAYVAPTSGTNERRD